MKSNYTFKHLDHSDALVEYTSEKLNEIAQYLLKDSRGSVSYSKNQYEFVVEVSINTRQKFFKATASADDVYVAVDLMVDRLEKQFLKVKEIYLDHKKFDKSREGKLTHTNDQLDFHPKFKRTG